MYDPNALSTAPPYRHVAWCYDALASAYSLGAIDRAKAWHTKQIEVGDRVLYAGAGCGREVALACRAGADVVCVEPCGPMADRLLRRTSRWRKQVTIDRRPIQSVPANAGYDLVTAHFFLNLFGPKTMPDVINKLCGFVKPGGRLVIADFAPSEPGIFLNRICLGCYYRPLNMVGWLLRMCALHPIYDYAPLVEQHEFVIEHTVSFPALPGLPAPYRVMAARRA